MTCSATLFCPEPNGQSVPMERTQKALVALIVAMLGISVLFFYAASIRPVDMAPGDIKLSDEGTLVRTEGVIGHPYIGNRSTTLDLVDVSTGDSVKVFVKFDLPDAVKAVLRSGARAVVQGDVTNYKDRPEVEVTALSGFRIEAPPEANEVSLGVMAGNRQLFDNITVSIHGTVKDLKSSWGDLNFSLSDGQFKALCKVNGYSSQIPLRMGTRYGWWARSGSMTRAKPT